jgi:hypothetical protein
VTDQTNHESIKARKALGEITLSATVKRADNDTFEITVNEMDYVVVAKAGETFTITIPIELSAS